MRFDLLSADPSFSTMDIAPGTSSEDDLISALDRVRDLRRDADRLVPRIIEVLQETTSERLRNASAVALADLRDPRGAQAIQDVLRRPGLAQCAGTLVYALEDMGASLPSDILVTIIRDGSYEARAMAMVLVEDGRIGTAADPLMKTALRVRLSEISEAGNVEAAEAARLALELIE